MQCHNYISDVYNKPTRLKIGWKLSKLWLFQKYIPLPTRYYGWASCEPTNMHDLGRYRIDKGWMCLLKALLCVCVCVCVCEGHAGGTAGALRGLPVEIRALRADRRHQQACHRRVWEEAGLQGDSERLVFGFLSPEQSFNLNLNLSLSFSVT